MPRDFDQIIRSKETDSWNRRWHGSIGTVSGGTVSLSVSSNLAGCSVQFLNGTAFLYFMQLPTADKINEFFVTPLKTSEGTALNIKLSHLFGTAFLNSQGYTVK